MVVGADLQPCADDVIPMTSLSALYIIMHIGYDQQVHMDAALVGFVSNGAGSVYS